MTKSFVTSREKKRTGRSILIKVAILFLLVLIGSAGCMFAVSGTWPSVVAIGSDSMAPNLNVGDMVFIVQEDRGGEIITGEEARAANTTTLGGYGDIIVYTPNGNTQTTAFIHRVVSWINQTDAITKYGLDPTQTTDGYLTKGDNNEAEDQRYAFTGVGRVYPVKEEWILGKALFRVPLIGYFLLHIWQIAALILIALLIYEWHCRREEKREEKEMREELTKN
ncbi:MAG: S26 family signal peptidase [Methanocorpusculum sp.]|nr:S26 family signal peptidase [Methanocorpusculum sp.]